MWPRNECNSANAENSSYNNKDKHLNYDSQDFDSGIVSGPFSGPLPSDDSGIVSDPYSGQSTSDLDRVSGHLTPDCTLHSKDKDSQSYHDSGYINVSSTFDSGLDLLDKLNDLKITSATALTTSTSSTTHNSYKNQSHQQTSITSSTSDPNVTESKIGITSAHLRILTDICFRDEDGDTALHVAVERGFVEAVYKITQLLPHQALLDVTNDNDSTPLHIAVSTGNHGVIRHLLVCGSSPVMRDSRGDTPLHIACRRGDLQAVEELTRPVNTTELHQARLFYIPLYRQGLLAADLTNYDGETCIHVAVQGKRANILDRLTSYGADINAKEGKGGKTALHYAVESRDCQLVSFIVKNCGASLNSETYGGVTPYQIAVTNGAIEVANELLKLGALDHPLSDSYTDDDDDLDYDDISNNFGGVGLGGCSLVDDFKIGGVSFNMGAKVPVSTCVPFNADRLF